MVQAVLNKPEVSSAKPKARVSSGSEPVKEQNLLEKMQSFRVEFGPGAADILNFTNQLSVMIRAGISLPDLYVWHIFLTTEMASGKLEFAVIDLHRMKRNVTNKNEQLKNLVERR